MDLKNRLKIILNSLSLLFVILFWENVLFTSISLVILLLIIFKTFNYTKKEILFLILTGIGGAFFEVLCVILGVWKYANPTPYIFIPFWLVLVWIVTASYVLELTKHMLLFLNQKDMENISFYRLSGLFFVLGLAIFSIMFLWELPELLFYILFILASIYIYVDKNFTRAYGFILASIIGSIAEIICVNFGIWTYTLPQLWGIPIWMFPGWGFGYLSVITLYLFFKKYIK
jgi:hypothetical protein